MHQSTHDRSINAEPAAEDETDIAAEDKGTTFFLT